MLPSKRESQRVQWIVPQQGELPTEKKSKSPESTQSNSLRQSKSIDTSIETNRESPLQDITQTYNSPQLQSKRTGHNKLDNEVCRTIVVIVEEYLKDLKEHQKLINQVRSEWIKSLNKDADDSNLIFHNDVSRLKVRDQQTRAIETIKQLTNYLREIFTLQRQTNNSDGSIDDAIINKLSDAKNNIIQALNDFILSNGDIDIPIIDPEDAANINDYEFCVVTRAQSKSLNGPSKFVQPHNHGLSVSSNCKGQNSLDTLNKENFPHQDERMYVGTHPNQTVETDSHIQLEKRKREIEKLHADSREICHLFSEFHNFLKVQGEQSDSIEDNIAIAAQNISLGKRDLEIPQKSIKTLRKLSLVLTLSGCVGGAILGGPLGMAMGSKAAGFTFVCATSFVGYLTGAKVSKCITGIN